MDKEIFKTKQKLNWSSFLKYVIFFVILYILSLAKIKGVISPFAIAFYITLCWCNQKYLLCGLLYVSAYSLANMTIEGIVISLFAFVIITIVFFIHKSVKRPISQWILVLYLVLANAILFYIGAGTAEKNFQALISIVFSIIFMFACLKICKTLLLRGISLKLTIVEIISICLIIFALSIGLCQIKILNIEFVKIFSVFLILLCSYLYSNCSATIVATIIGLGIAVCTGSFLPLAGYVVLSVASLSFKSTHKYFSIIAISLVDVVLGLYFNVWQNYSVYSFIPIVIASFMFILISQDTFSILQVMMGGISSQIAIRNIVNRSRDALCKRMFEISSIFEEMNRVFRSTVKGVLPEPEAKRMLSQEIISRVCADCPDKHKCLRVMADETTKVMDNIVSAGFEKGKVTILDVPPFLTTRCNKVNLILSNMNQLLVSYKQYAQIVNSLDTSKVLIAEQLSGVSKLLQVLGTETKQNVSFNIEKENQIIDELNYFNIVASEVILYEQEQKMIKCSILLRDKDKSNKNIEKVVSKICGTKMIISSSLPSSSAGFYLIELVASPKYDVIFGSSGCPKFENAVSGDTYSFLKLTQNKMLLAICDGMGTGTEAQQVSDTAISLIENFYKAGFDNDIILSSVNKLLTITSEDVFSALDICVIDLDLGAADFVKVGAPEGFIKHIAETEVLKSGALPLGILEEIQPTIIKKMLIDSDMVVMLSDGVIDGFDNLDVLNQYINTLKTTNPQTMSEQILDYALKKYKGKPEDDCTVICARTIVRR